MRNEYSQPYGVAQLGTPNLIAGVFGDGRGGEDTAKANAKAIAALPDLLKALEFVTKYAGMQMSKGKPLPGQLTSAVYAAMEKAGYTF